MSRHHYSKRGSDWDDVTIFLAAARMLRQRGHVPSGATFERVVADGLIDGAADVTLCDETFTSADIRASLASRVKHVHAAGIQERVERDPADALLNATEYPIDLPLVVLALDGMSPDERQQALQTVMQEGIDQSDWQMSILAVELGLDTSSTDRNGLGWLLTVQDLEKAVTWVAQALLDNGADPNARNQDGETPLHALAYGCDNGLVSVLLNGGADPLIRDNFGRRAIDKVEGMDEDGTVTFSGVNIDEDDHKVLRDATREAERAALAQVAEQSMGQRPAQRHVRQRL